MWPTQGTRVFRSIDMYGKVRKCLAAGVSVLPCLVAIVAYGGVASTPHNLSVSGPGPIKSPTETRICVFCHTPHNARPDTPLWNREFSAVTHYEMYLASTESQT